MAYSNSSLGLVGHYDSAYKTNWTINTGTITTDTINKQWQESVNKILGTRKDDKFMYKYYYNVIVISTKGTVLLDTKVLAMNDEDAKFEADVHAKLKATELNLSDVTVLVNNLGSVKLEKVGDK